MDEKIKISMMETLQIKTASPFKDLFPIRESVLNEIIEDMKENGFDCGHPIIVWAGHKVTVVDGHTRLAAALRLGKSKVPITLKEFADETAALQYAIRAQRNRRNLTDPELLKCLNELDKRKSVGRPKKTPSCEGISGESAKNTADLLGISRAKVERLRAINDHASDDVKNAVLSGKLSANKAYKATMNARREAQPDAEEDDSTENNKAERQTALIDSICGMIEARIDREKREYPGISYSEEEIDHVRQAIISKLNAELNKLTMKGTN